MSAVLYLRAIQAGGKRISGDASASMMAFTTTNNHDHKPRELISSRCRLCDRIRWWSSRRVLSCGIKPSNVEGVIAPKPCLRHGISSCVRLLLNHDATGAGLRGPFESVVKLTLCSAVSCRIPVELRAHLSQDSIGSSESVSETEWTL